MLVSIVSAPSRRRPVARQARRRRKCAETDLKRAAAGAPVIPRLRIIDTQSRPARHQRETALGYTSGRTGRRLLRSTWSAGGPSKKPAPESDDLGDDHEQLTSFRLADGPDRQIGREHV